MARPMLLIKDKSNPPLRSKKRVYQKKAPHYRPLLDMANNPMLVAVVFVFFLPLGIVLVWLNEKWSQRKKWLLSGLAVLWFGFCSLGMTGDERRLTKQYDEANQQWMSGQKDQAFAKYMDIITNHRSLVESNFTTIGKNSPAIVFGRVIDYLAVKGDSQALEMVRLAKKKGYQPDCQTIEGKRLLQKE